MCLRGMRTVTRRLPEVEIAVRGRIKKAPLHRRVRNGTSESLLFKSTGYCRTIIATDHARRARRSGVQANRAFCVRRFYDYKRLTVCFTTCYACDDDVG